MDRNRNGFRKNENIKFTGTALSLLLFFLYFSSPAGATLYELGGNFGYSKQVYGDNRQNSIVSRTYSGSLAIYLWNATGLEMNYSQTEDIITENDQIQLDVDTYINSVQNRIMTKLYGFGVRQALAPKGFPVVPVISLGYAKQRKSGKTVYTLEESGIIRYIEFQRGETTSDSVFGTFLLKIHITQFFSLNGSVKTVFPAFEFNQARDSVKYEAGFSWIF